MVERFVDNAKEVVSVWLRNSIVDIQRSHLVFVHVQRFLYDYCFFYWLWLLAQLIDDDFVLGLGHYLFTNLVGRNWLTYPLLTLNDSQWTAASK